MCRLWQDSWKTSQKKVQAWEFTLSPRIRRMRLRNAIYNNLVKKKEGLHLGGNVGAQNILNFDYISYKEQNKVQKTGVAMLPSVDGELTSTRLIIPLAGKADAEK